MEEHFDMKKLVDQTDKEIESLPKKTNMILFFEQFNSKFNNYYMKHGKHGNLHPSFDEEKDYRKIYCRSIAAKRKESCQSLKNKNNV
jgi:hypothetical protein